jgi:hypothetical protein
VKDVQGVRICASLTNHETHVALMPTEDVCGRGGREDTARAQYTRHAVKRGGCIDVELVGLYGETSTASACAILTDPMYQLHATDEEGKKMDVELVHQNVLTFLGAGQVTTSSALSWVGAHRCLNLLCVERGDAAVVLSRHVSRAGAKAVRFAHRRGLAS